MDLITLKALAALASNAYNNGQDIASKIINDQVLNPGGVGSATWRVLSSDDLGFNAIERELYFDTGGYFSVLSNQAYVAYNQINNQVVVVFRGTNSVFDAAADIAIGLGLLEPALATFLPLIAKVHDFVSRNSVDQDVQLLSTGHSLGGTLAELLFAQDLSFDGGAGFGSPGLGPIPWLSDHQSNFVHVARTADAIGVYAPAAHPGISVSIIDDAFPSLDFITGFGGLPHSDVRYADQLARIAESPASSGLTLLNKDKVHFLDGTKNNDISSEILSKYAITLGGDLRDIFRGASTVASLRIEGGKGADEIVGGSAGDWLSGGPDNDLVRGGNGVAANLYVSDDRGQLFKIDANGLLATKVGSPGTVLTDLAFAPDGRLYGISLGSLYLVNPTSGQQTFVGSLGVSNANGLAIDGAGRAYVSVSFDEGGGYLYRVNLGTGAVTSIGGGAPSAGDLVFHDGKLYLSTSSGAIAQVDPNSGTILSSRFANVHDLYGLGELGGTTYGFAGSTIYRVDVETGQSASLGTYSSTFMGTVNGAATNDFAQANGSVRDVLNGGSGNDTIEGSSGSGYLRGDEGNDSIVGGTGFDDINGNMGNDTCISGGGDDWVVGGKDNDSLAGGAGYNLVYGNLGNDTCDGGLGNDTVRGGQNDDVVSGGAGDDFVSGDKGADTMTGGSGADVFHSFGETGLDRVTDFNLAQGDRVQLDSGTQYTLAQAGADTIITMTGGGQMILVGISISSLTGSWIV